MMKRQVHTPEQALAYLTDCTLATVADLASKRSRPKGEFERQKEIARTALQWMRELGVDYSSTRGKEVDEWGGVDAWADQYMPERTAL